ncbi:MAG: helix-turn-helix domain-containing protein [Campylobacterota bacterium]|nr:helix-turn-helix domain-containing protein [Campylobacterota bacterium]
MKLKLNLSNETQLYFITVAQHTGKTAEEVMEDFLNTEVSDIITLKNGYFYKKSIKLLFDDQHKPIEFTNLEQEIFAFLISNANTVVDHQDILDNVWAKKDASIFTMRNIVKKIRDKSYTEIIKSHSGRGYQISV